MEILAAIIVIIAIYFIYQYYLSPQKSISSSMPFKSIQSVDSVFQNPTNIPDEILENTFNEVIDSFLEGKNVQQAETNLMLKRGERLIFDIPKMLLCEERSVKVKGGYQGFSVRIMKGVSYRFGGFEAGSERRIVGLDEGNFILTNKRIVFSGNKLSKDVPLNKINTIRTLENGIAITRSGKQKTEYYMGTQNLSFEVTVTPEFDDAWKEEKVQWFMTGLEVKKMINILLTE